MGRHAKQFPTKLLRACVQASVVKAVKIKLSERNYFNPEKPAHGDISKLIENLLIAWLKSRVPAESLVALLKMKTEKEVLQLNLKTPSNLQATVHQPVDFPLDLS